MPAVAWWRTRTKCRAGSCNFDMFAYAFFKHDLTVWNRFTRKNAPDHIFVIIGRLLLVHGLIDENVHFRHTARFINSLIENRKRYDLILFPCERHSPHKLQDRVYLEDRISEFFDEHLRGGAAAASAKLVAAAAADRPAPSHTGSGTSLKLTAHL